MIEDGLLIAGPPMGLSGVVEAANFLLRDGLRAVADQPGAPYAHPRQAPTRGLVGRPSGRVARCRP